MKAVLYIRKSTKDQNSELQHRELTDFVCARGWNLVKVYEDASSGTNDQRQKLQEMLAAARKRDFDIIVVWKMDRLFRSLKHLVNTLQEFEELGICFVSLRENLDLTTSAGRLMTHILAAFAQFEADLIKERVYAGLANAKAKGVKIGRPRLGKEAEIKKLRLKGMTYSQIEKELGVSAGAIRRALTPAPKSPSSEGAKKPMKSTKGLRAV